MPAHIMIDLETMDTKPSAMILSAAFVCFTRTQHLVSSEYYTLDPASQTNRTISESTARWWLGQSADARKLLAEKERMPLREMLETVSRYLKEFDGIRVWANGPMFDISILEHAFEQYGLPVPWSFRDVRCVRTILTVAGVDLKHIPSDNLDVAHNALDDAVHQARGVMAAWGRLDARGGVVFTN